MITSALHRSRVPRLLAGSSVLLAVVLGLGACGGSDDAAPASGSSAGAAPSDAPGGGGQQMQQVQACLKAAGIDVPTPSAFPSGMPSGGPPTGMPSGMPSGGPGGGRPGGVDFNDKKVQAALKACGISVPTGRPSMAPSAG